MKIFEVVMGSNHFLIQDQTVGKNAGAPMIWGFALSVAINKNKNNIKRKKSRG